MLIQGTNEFFPVFDRAALRGGIASYQFTGVLCDCRKSSTEGTLGAFQKAN